MFTINENRIDNSRNDAPVTEPSNDMTQRIPLDGTAKSVQRPVNPQRRQKKRWFMTKKEKITLITLGSVTAALLIAAIIMVSTMFTAPADDGLILKGVVAAGVNIGGMTPQEAADALQEATANTYSKLDMVVTVLDSKITLSPADTGASLDIQAVVQDAYNYGRTGSRAEQTQAKNNALTNSVIIPITPHLNLDTNYIRSEINKLGAQFSSTLTQPKLTLKGTKPAMGVSKPDVTQVHQTLEIYVGTAEYGLDTNKLYNQVLEYYNINIFQVVHTPTVLSPDSIEEDLLEYYNNLCVEPVDAQMNPVTFDITPEVYGYGFNLNEVKEQIAKAPYGTTLTIELTYLTPNLTQDMISSNLFKNVMGENYSPLSIDPAWNFNATLAAEKLNGLIIKSGDVFSFNEALGELTVENGYMEALAYRGTVVVPMVGGGVTHTASVLYNTVLEAELEILECRNHTYATDFIDVGCDVYVAEGKADFRFRNTRPDPIRIKAEVVDGYIYISIEGTDSREYKVEISTEIVQTIPPDKLYNVMQSDNPGGYKNNDILSLGMNGYIVELYKSTYSKQDGSLISKSLISTFEYEAKDSVVVKLQNNATEPPASDENPDPLD